MKLDLKGKNLLDLVPVRIIEHEKRENGEINLLLPRFKNKFFQKIFIPKSKSPYLTIKLDKLGSTFWEFCDGNSTVYEIGIKMKEIFGESMEPTYERLRKFIIQLMQSDCMSLTERK